MIFSEVSTPRVSVSFCELSLANFCSRASIFSRSFTNSSSFSARIFSSSFCLAQNRYISQTTKKVVFSRDRIEFDKMNVIYNMSDVCFTLSYAEGFGLSTLESMMTGTPIVAPKTGGLTRQVVDHRDGTENGAALPIDLKTLVGSQSVPYIYEDYCTVEDAADAIFELYNQ